MNETILLKYFSNTISPDELREVKKWLDASEENRKTAEDIYHIYYSTETLRKMKSIDMPKAYKSIHKKINRRHKLNRFQWIQRIAIIFLIPFLSISLYLLLKEEPINTILEVKTNPGMVTSFTLPDNTKVWLNTSSTIIYPSVFTDEHRTVELIGEAYFDVSKENERKFIVKTNKNTTIEVLGTQFNVEAYPENDNVVTTLIEGEVQLTYLSNADQKTMQLMKPGEKTIYNSKNKKIVTQETFITQSSSLPDKGNDIINSPLSVETAWKDMKVVLRNTSLEEMLEILGKRFDTEFIILNDKLKENSFTGTFENQQLSRILEHLRIASGINYKIIDPQTGETGIKEKTKVELY